MEPGERVRSSARAALWLLLGINLFNYIDRYVLSAVEPEIRAHFFAPSDPNAHALTGLLGTAFLVSYMVAAPIFGWLADRTSRWLIIGVSVLLWSGATAASGIAGTFAVLFAMRLLVGVGEGGYGPAAPTIISDLSHWKSVSRAVVFYVAIPVGSAWLCHWRLCHSLGLRRPCGRAARVPWPCFIFFRRDPRDEVKTLKQNVTQRCVITPA
jgi:MFS family permease